MADLKHQGCGGLVIEDLSMPGYEDDTGLHPALKCLQCGDEVIGDPGLEWASSVEGEGDE